MSSLDERTRLSRALNDIDIRIHANLGFDDIMQSALDGFVETLGADAGDIKLIDGDNWTVRYERGFGADEVGVQLSAAKAPVAVEAARTRLPVVVSDLLREQAIPYVGFPRKHGLKATIGVPLVVRGDVVGCLFAWMRSGPREFSAGELDFARRIAASVALALENSRLYDSEKQARARAENAEQRLGVELARTRILLKASDALSSTIDPDELLVRLGSILCEATGIDRVFINLIDLSQRVLLPKVATGGLVAPGGDRIPLEQLSETSQAAIRNARTVVLDYEGPDVPPYDLAIARANAARLVLFVPLMQLDEVIGHVTLDQPGQRYDFTDEQIRVVESITAQAAVALQNARIFDREHRIAETLQQALLAPPEHIDNVDVAILYQAASAAAGVGGDFYDVFALDDEHAALLVGDVAGKGVLAAQLTALMRDGARAYLLETGDPAESFRRLNALAYRFTPQDKFATAFLAVLNHTSGQLRYCNAAHPEPRIMGADVLRVIDSLPCGLLGAFPDAGFTSHETTLAPGEILVMITDGVTEARRGAEQFGDGALTQAFEKLRDSRVADLPKALLRELDAFTDGKLRDDVVVLCVSRTPET